MIFRSQPNDFSISAKRFLNRLVSFEACIEGFFPSSTPFYTRIQKRVRILHTSSMTATYGEGSVLLAFTEPSRGCVFAV